MNRILSVAVACFFAAPIAVASAAEKNCPNPGGALGVSRIVEIDTKAGPLYGDFSKYEREPRFLGPKEVVLTFDDGPVHGNSPKVLDALAAECVKATFFMIGLNVAHAPSLVRRAFDEGHSIGTHTLAISISMRCRSRRPSRRSSSALRR